ncbi:hypothetical protein PFISCL1PPCAC_6539 [Pristionchus fissidentatus]|uniref:Membrane transporter n=1 Tax=Pristionchus fissidentatus TaxID=1538716 RepID=A0AAV5V8X2_9BILA|nr:hypothetical protein PFISCL1PPCAC_6539 [Pristionchus fissidentatus]
MRRVSMGAAEALKNDEILQRPRTFRDSKHFQPLMVAFLCFGFATFLSVYMLYYMKVFLDVYHISTDWIRIVQALFLVWNAVNDPMMGYFQDIGCCGMTWIMDRRKVIMYCAPVFAFSYMIFWFPWSTTNTVIVGLHLLVGLFLFDTLLTLVLSAYCGILVEACAEHSQRVRCLVYAELFGILGGSIIFPLNVFSNEAKDFGRFQIGCVIIAVIGAASMSAGAYFLNTKKEHEIHEEIEMAKDPDSEMEKEAKEKPFKKAMRVSWQIVREPRFLCLVGTGFMRSLRTVATDSFLIILIQALVSRPGFMESGSPALSAFYSIIRPIGSIMFMFLWKPLALLGTHRMMMILLIAALINVTVSMIIGRGNPLAVIIYIGVEQIAAGTGGHAFGMLLAGEVVDTDTKINKRTSPLSTLIFTLKALFTKPAEQLSPLIFITLLERGGFSAHRNECLSNAESLMSNTNSTAPFTTAASTALEQPHCTILLDTMHSSMLYFTLFCTLGELIIVSIDYWYKKRVLHEEDKKTNPLEIPLNEEEFVKKREV